VDVVCENASLTAKIQHIDPELNGIAGYQADSLFGAGHVGTRPFNKIIQNGD
jgi:riboflavin kinase/FMN adenylyltransferase